MICTFFGHRDTTHRVKKALLSVLIDLIENKNVDLFYVGNHGNFDEMVRKNLKLLRKRYPHIKYAVVVAYENTLKNYPDGVYLEKLQSVYPRLAIIERNKWLIEVSDYVVTHVTREQGGAGRFKRLAESQNKTIINLI